MHRYDERTYRQHTSTRGLVSFTVRVQETDLFISAAQNLQMQSRQTVLQARASIEKYIHDHPKFRYSLEPLPLDGRAPAIVQKMLSASAACGVGPMAAVAGAVAEQVGVELLSLSPEVIVENGGDLFLKVSRDITISVFAGESPLSQQIGIRITASETPCSVCTSSGRVGPSLSLGSSDAVTVRSKSASLADAAATAIGNIIKDTSDIPGGIETAGSIRGIDGILIIKDGDMGAWGNIELVLL